MASNLNKVTLIGFLAKDPEIRHTQDGVKVVTLVVGTSEYWKDRQSEEWRERTEWHRVIIFNPRFADLAERSLKKGSKVYVEGQIQGRKYTDPQTGQESRTVDIVIRAYRGEIMPLDSNKEKQAPQPEEGKSHYFAQADRNHEGSEEMEDAIPF